MPPDLSRTELEALEFLAHRGGAVLVTQITARTVRDPAFNELRSIGSATIRSLEASGLVETTEEDGDWTPMVKMTDAGWSAIKT